LEDKKERNNLLAALPAVLAELNDKDKELIEALYVKNISTREYAKSQSVSQRTIIKRRDRVFKILEKNRVFTYRVFGRGYRGEKSFL